MLTPHDVLAVTVNDDNDNKYSMWMTNFFGVSEVQVPRCEGFICEKIDAVGFILMSCI